MTPLKTVTCNAATPAPVHLPVFSHREEILKAVRSSQITILTGETGSGKTTGIAQILFEAGYDQIRITQPRISAATSVAEFVAKNLCQEIGDSVGYKTSLHKCVSKNTQILFITDGLQLAQEAHGHGIPNREDCVIVIDEHHERSTNIDALVAVLIKRIKKGARFRLVFSSATADVVRLKSWLAPILGQSIPHVHVSGRTFPVTENLIPADAALEATLRELQNGRNVLVFQPGVKQIEAFCEDLYKAGIDAEILPLHAKLSKPDQDKVFVAYPRPKVVVATNIAQTSITISDLDVVVDTGLERHPVVDDYGAPGLTMALTSRADCDQRKGRCGRTRPGTYYLAGAPRDCRRDFPLVEINSSNLEGLVLRLKAGGYKPERLQWLDAPCAKQLELARDRLKMLKATKGNGQLTKIGHEMVRLPLEPSYGRMVCEASRRGVLPDVLVMVAIASTGALLFDADDRRFKDMAYAYDSNFIFTKDIFLDTFRDERIEEPADLDDWLEDKGIAVQHYRRAKELYLGLCKSFNLPEWQGFGAITKEKDMLACIFAGLWPYGVWQVRGQYAVDIAGNHRLISQHSAVPEENQLIVGEPFNLTKDNGETLYLLQRVSVVPKKVVREVLPYGGLKNLPAPKAQKELKKPKKGKKNR